MAFAIDPNQQQQQQQLQGVPGASATQPVSTSAAPGAGPSGTRVPTGAPNQQSPAQPFTNLQAYLSANAPQIQNQANTISGNLQNQYGQIQKDINAGAQNFGQQVQAGYTPENQQLVQQAAANPTQFVQDPNNVKAFQSQLNDQYTGPTNFEGTAGYGPLNAEVNQNVSNANLIGTPAGLQTYLQGTEKNPTQGENLLDTVLLQQSPNAIQQVQQAASPFSQLPAFLSSAVSTADQAAQAAPVAAQTAATDAMAAMNPVISSFQNTLAGEVPAAQAQQNAYNAIVNQNASNLNPMNTALNSFEQSSGVTGLANPLTSYLNQQQLTGAPSLSSVATAPQYAEDAALAQLMGASYNPALNQANVGQAGTFSVPTATLANQQSLAQQIADLATQGTYSQKEVPPITGYKDYLAQTKPHLVPPFPDQQLAQAIKDLSATTPTAQSQVMASTGLTDFPNFYSNYNAAPYEQLLQYLSGINPSGISKSGNNYIVNS